MSLLFLNTKSLFLKFLGLRPEVDSPVQKPVKLCMYMNTLMGILMYIDVQG